MSQDQPSTKNSKPAPKESSKSPQPEEKTQLPYLRETDEQEQPSWNMSQFSPFDVYHDVSALLRKVRELQNAVNYFIHKANSDCDCMKNK